MLSMPRRRRAVFFMNVACTPLIALGGSRGVSRGDGLVDERARVMI